MILLLLFIIITIIIIIIIIIIDIQELISYSDPGGILEKIKQP